MFLIFFIFLLPITIFLILHLMSRKKAKNEAPTDPTEVCALCQNDFPMNQLLEKEVGSYGRVYCFCMECIEKLYNEFKNQTGIKTGE